PAMPRSRTSIWGAPVLEIVDLHSYYGEAHVVQGASLHVGASEVVALLGRNGMGKTSLIRSIMRLPAPQVRGGEFGGRGESLKGLAPHRRGGRKVGYVPQGRRLFPSLPVTEPLPVLNPATSKEGWTVDKVFALFPRLSERKNHR